ncbi:MAG TPA: cytochrome C [Gammaproteobacteria bacterium]
MYFGKILLRMAVAALLLAPLMAQAVPSYSRQTQLDCATCHTVFPQLTPYGRQFKLSGYTAVSGPFSAQSQPNLRLSEDVMAPLSAMLLVDYTSMKGSDSGVNGAKNKATVEFPQEFSIFYAGRISDAMGAYAQVTLDSANSIAMDNVDVRYARNTALDNGSLVYGVSLNNSPLVEDIYNTTPVWGFPFTSSEYANNPDFGTLLGSGAFAQTTAGAVAYAMLNNHWYVAAGSYHDTQAGGETTEGLNGWAPYARVAYQSEMGHHNFHLGGYLMAGKVTQDVNAPLASTSTRFRDSGVDGQYQYLSGVNTLTLRANYINEKLDEALNMGASKDNLNIRNVSVNTEYFYDRTYGFAVGRFCVQGRPDPVLYAADPANGVSGSISGSPDTEGWLAELTYLPWLNTKFSLQYVAYSEFDGGSSYISANTGAPREANQNNTLYLSAWFVF